METYITYMPAGGYGNPSYIDHCLGVVTAKQPNDDGTITLTAAEYEAGERVELRSHRTETVYDVEMNGNTVILIPS
jgi:hypothetical protein